MGDRNDHNDAFVVGWAGCMVEKAVVWVSRVAPHEVPLKQRLPLKTQQRLPLEGVEAWVARMTMWLLPFLPTVSFCPHALF